MSFCADTLKTAEEICELVFEKMSLSRLWTYLDSVISTFKEQEIAALGFYCSNQYTSDAGQIRLIRSSAIKFMRRARRLNEFENEFGVVQKYYCLLGRIGGGIKS